MVKKSRVPILVLTESVALLSGLGYAAYLVSWETSKEYGNPLKTTEEKKPEAFILNKPGTLYTSVADALDAAVSGDVVVLVPPKLPNYSNSNQKATDSVTYHLDRIAVIKEGVSLVLPTDQASVDTIKANGLASYITSMQNDEHTDTTNQTGHAISSPSRYRRVQLIIDEGVTLTNKGTIVVSGGLSGGTAGVSTIGQTSRSYAEILLNEGASIVQDGAEAKSYVFGHISESGNTSFFLNNGELYVPFVVYDFRGISFSHAMTGSGGAIQGKHSSPFNQFGFPNVAASLRVSNAASVYGCINAWIDFQGFRDSSHQSMLLIGPSNGAVFQLPDENSYVEYHYHRADDCADISFHGNLVFNPPKVTFSIESFSITIDMADVFFPVSYRHKVEFFPASSGTSNVDFGVQRFKILPGSAVTINSGVTMTSGPTIVYSTFYDGSLGNGQYSSNAYSSKKYPLLPGADFKVQPGAVFKPQSFAGTVYNGNTSTPSTLPSRRSVQPATTEVPVSYEPWSTGNGPVSQPQVVNEYVVIKENTQVVPLSYLSRQRLYIGVNTFYRYETYTPIFDIYINGSLEPYTTVEGKQNVYFFDDLKTYRLDFKNDIYKVYGADEFYEMESEVTYNPEEPTLGVVNSATEVSSELIGEDGQPVLGEDGEPINQFEVQRVDIKAATPPLSDGRDPLYPGFMIVLKAEVVDATTAYDKEIKWSTSDPSIATVDQKGQVTGVALGPVTIYAECGGKIGEYQTEVIEEVKQIPVESFVIYQKENPARRSDAVAGSDYNGSSNFNYNGLYENGDIVSFAITDMLPEGSSYIQIKWDDGSGGNFSNYRRWYVGPNGERLTTVEGVDEVTVHFPTIDEYKTINPDASYVTGDDSDQVSITCTLTNADGSTVRTVFTASHDGDFTICFLPNTRILMSDGTYKEVKDIKIEEKIMAFDHFSGKLQAMPLLMLAKHNEGEQVLIELSFSNGKALSFLTRHGLFDLESRAYVDVSPASVGSLLGHRFATFDEEGRLGEGVLLSYSLMRYHGHSYSIASYGVINAIAETFLSITPPFSDPGLSNFFDYREDLSYDPASVKENIAKYGLYRYGDLAKVRPQHFFDSIGAKHFKIGVEKGLITEEEIGYWADYFLGLVQTGEAILNIL